MNRLRSLLVDGLLLALPLGAAAFLSVKVIELLRKLLAPAARLLPEGRWIGIAAVEILAIVVLLILLLILGLFARSALGRRVAAGIENVVLSQIPGYLIIKTIASDLVNVEDESNLSPALITLDDNSVLGFIIERSSDSSMFTVFVPDAPGAGSGSVLLLPSTRIQALDVPPQSVLRAMKKRGLGLQALANSAKKL
jgi:uncharacterized membrane protein